MERENKPTSEDAHLLIELVKLSTTDRSVKAYRWFFTEFVPKKITDYVEYRRQYPMGSEESGHIGEIMGWYELAGALVENGLLNENLLFDAAPPPKFFWEALKPIIYGERAEMKEPRIGENFELLYERSKKWEKTHPPKINLVTA
jgi:hypothetical protein